MSGYIMFDRKTGKIIEKGQPQSVFANISSITPKAWYLEQIKSLKEKLSKTKDEDTRLDIILSIKQLGDEMLEFYPE